MLSDLSPSGGWPWGILADRTGWAAGAAIAAVLFTGCATGERNTTVEPAAVREQPPREVALAEVERRYVIGPRAARAMGLRVDWQHPNIGPAPRLIEMHDDSVLTLDRENFLMRLDREDGSRIWRIPAAEQVDHIFSITYAPDRDRVLLLTGSAVLEMDSANGHQIARQRLESIANTPALRAGQFLLYGSRNGQLVWHSHVVAFQLRGYRISPAINVAPQMAGGIVVTVGNDGRVAAHDVARGNMRWDKRLIDRVVAHPAVNGDSVYIAGMDHHLWAFDLYTGRNMWRYLTEHPLRQPPTVIGEKVYQQIPGEGLVAFEARPVNKPGGSVVWRNQDVRGNVLCQRGGRLLVWDSERKLMTIVEATRGGIVETIELPQVHRIQVSGLDGSEILAASEDGRLTRLVARN